MSQTVQKNFTGGEISPALRSRSDVSKYANGLALCENMIVKTEGGVYSRPGTKFITEQADSSQRGRLIPFQFNTEQTYILVFEHLKMRVIKDGGLVLAGGGPSIYELVTPYSSTDLPRIQYIQSADVMTIVHPDYSPMNLSRTADDNWSLASIDFTPTIDQPVWASNTTKAISAATQANPCQLTIAGHTFITGNTVGISGVVGMTELNGNNYVITVVDPNTITLDGVNSTAFTAYVSGGTATRGFLTTSGSGGGGYTKTYSYVVSAVDSSGEESLPSIVASITTASLSTTYGVVLDWADVTGAEYYRVYKDPSDGTGVYGWIGDSNVTRFVDFNIAPITSDAPQKARDPFAGTDNKPSAITYYQQRRVYANTNEQPQTVFTSQTGLFNNMRTSTPTRDSDAVTFTINSKQVNQIRHLIELDSLIILTSGAEYRATEGQDQVLTPSTVGIRKQSQNGSSWTSPVVVNDTIIYVQEKGSRIRDLNFEFVDDRYKGSDLSIMARHLFDDHTIDEMSFSAEPYGIVWCVRSDGVLLGLTYQREHQVWGWHHHVTKDSTSDSSFESVATVSEDGRDATYVIVRRTIDGQTVRYVERFEKRIVSDPSNVWCVDCGLQYSGSPVTTVTGLDHLNGENVVATADGYGVAGLTVVSGQITLPFAASTVTVGLPFTPVIETLDIDVTSASETLKGREVSVSKLIVEVEKSRGFWVGPKKDNGSTGTFMELKFRNPTSTITAPPLRTLKEEIRMEPQWSLGGGIRIEQREPMPLTILSIIPDVDIN